MDDKIEVESDLDMQGYVQNDLDHDDTCDMMNIDSVSLPTLEKAGKTIDFYLMIFYCGVVAGCLLLFKMKIWIMEWTIQMIASYVCIK